MELGAAEVSEEFSVAWQGSLSAHVVGGIAVVSSFPNTQLHSQGPQEGSSEGARGESASCQGIGVSLVSTRLFLNPVSSAVYGGTLSKLLNTSEPHFLTCEVRTVVVHL